MLPVVALVGRPNVGKSTLFNLLTRSRQALVADVPGVTRDRHYGVCRRGQKPFIVIDTGGLQNTDDELDAVVSAQADKAIEEADAVIYLADAGAGLMPQDASLLQRLRQTGKPLLLAVNKADKSDEASIIAEFSSVGIQATRAVSATHNSGMDGLLESLSSMLPAVADPLAEAADDDDIRVAVIGRPNAGKSTLINRLIGEERLAVSSIAGTTRDAIEVKMVRADQAITLIDTAGVRRRARVSDAVEKFSVIKTIQAINQAHVVVVLVDARENLADQDLTLIGRVLEEGRALVIAVNKWDGLDDYQRDQCLRALDRRLSFVPWAKRIRISALHGSGLNELMQAVTAAYTAARANMTTADLTRTLELAFMHNQPALTRGHMPKLRYAHQGGSNPPTIIIHGSRTKYLSRGYQRYLENTFRKRYQLEGTPVRIRFRDSENPFAGRINKLSERQKARRRRMIAHHKKSKR